MEGGRREEVGGREGRREWGRKGRREGVGKVEGSERGKAG